MSGTLAELVMMVLGGLVAFACAYGLTGALRRYAQASQLIDAPGPRSSHQVPTPRGGGLSIVLVSTVAMAALCWLQLLSVSAFVGITGAGAIVAAVGFWDDHGHLAAHWRLCAHFVAASWGLFWLGGMPPLMVAGNAVDFGLASELLAAVFLVWLINLYNFMDGIDAIAGVEAITVCLSGALLNWLLVGDTAGALLPVMLAAACAGFLLWNLPPAKIFMGDAGSGFIGLMLGLLCLQATWLAPQLLWAWLILLGVFVTDASVTLLRRLVRREKVHQAHRSHAYQYAARRHRSHGRVASAVGIINCLWLLPLAALVALGRLDALLAVPLAYLPLVVLVWYYKAGDQRAQARAGLA